jgi:hypothetical protein
MYINPYLFKSHPIANGKYKSHSLPVSADPSAPWERRKKEKEETGRNIEKHHAGCEVRDVDRIDFMLKHVYGRDRSID